LEIFGTVVVGDLVARLDVLDRAQDHAALDNVGFSVGTTGVIGIAGNVAAAAVGDDERALLDRRGREQPEPGARAADAIRLGRAAARPLAWHDRRRLR